MRENITPHNYSEHSHDECVTINIECYQVQQSQLSSVLERLTPMLKLGLEYKVSVLIFNLTVKRLRNKNFKQILSEYVILHYTF